MKAHCRAGLQYVDILREDAGSRGDDDGVARFLGQLFEHPHQAAVSHRALVERVPSKVTRGEGRKLRLSCR